MRDAVIVEAVRMPVGKRNGGLSGVRPADLSAGVLKALSGPIDTIVTSPQPVDVAPADN